MDEDILQLIDSRHQLLLLTAQIEGDALPEALEVLVPVEEDDFNFASRVPMAEETDAFEDQEQPVMDGPGDSEHPGIGLHDLELLLQEAVPHLLRGPLHPFKLGHTIAPYEGMDGMMSDPFFYHSPGRSSRKLGGVPPNDVGISSRAYDAPRPRA